MKLFSKSKSKRKLQAEHEHSAQGNVISDVSMSSDSLASNSISSSNPQAPQTPVPVASIQGALTTPPLPSAPIMAPSAPDLAALSLTTLAASSTPSAPPSSAQRPVVYRRQDSNTLRSMVASGEPFVFLSYSHKDVDFVRYLRLLLEQQSILVWMDEKGLVPGTVWTEMLQEAIEGSAAVIVVMSHHSEQSAFVKGEVLHSMHLRKSIFPILLNGEPWFYLRAYQNEDMTQGLNSRLSDGFVSSIHHACIAAQNDNTSNMDSDTSQHSSSNASNASQQQQQQQQQQNQVSIELEFVQKDVRKYPCDHLILKHAQAFFGADQVVFAELRKHYESKPAKDGGGSTSNGKFGLQHVQTIPLKARPPRTATAAASTSKSSRLNLQKYFNIPTDGCLSAKNAIYIPTAPIYEWDYSDIRDFGKRAISSVLEQGDDLTPMNDSGAASSSSAAPTSSSAASTRPPLHPSPNSNGSNTSIASGSSKKNGDINRKPMSKQSVAMTMHGVGFGFDEQGCFKAQLGGILERLEEFVQDYIASSSSSSSFQDLASVCNIEKITIIELNASRLKRIQGYATEYFQDMLKKDPNTTQTTSDTTPSPKSTNSNHNYVQWDGKRLILQAPPQNTPTVPPLRMHNRSMSVTGIPVPKYALVIMPSNDGELDDVFYYGIQKAMHANDLLCERLTISAPRSNDEVQRRLSRIQKARMVVVCVGHMSSGSSSSSSSSSHHSQKNHRSNKVDSNLVYMHLGCAWGANIPAVFITKSDDTIHGLNEEYCIRYKRIKDVEEELTKLVKQVSNTTNGFNSPQR